MHVSCLPAVSFFLGAKSGPASMLALDAGRKRDRRADASDTQYSRSPAEMSPGPDGGDERHKYYRVKS